ncbi:hypothetical protein CPB86DRAFT_821372 [Serendipita vermifera]|nr:hypothetical protein CPB86DRAFT_821372 [Serendipita vermifera]
MEAIPNPSHPATTELMSATCQDPPSQPESYIEDEINTNNGPIYGLSRDTGFGSAESLIKSPTSSLFSLSTESTCDSSSEDLNNDPMKDHQNDSPVASTKSQKEQADLNSRVNLHSNPRNEKIDQKECHATERHVENGKQAPPFKVNEKVKLAEKDKPAPSSNNDTIKVSNTELLQGTNPLLSKPPTSPNHRGTSPDIKSSRPIPTNPYLWKVDLLLSKVRARHSQGVVYSGSGILPSACFVHLSNPSSPTPPTRRTDRVDHRAIFNATHKQGRYRESTADVDMEMCT